MFKEMVYNTKPFKIELTDYIIASNSKIAMSGIILSYCYLLLYSRLALF